MRSAVLLAVLAACSAGDEVSALPAPPSDSTAPPPRSEPAATPPAMDSADAPASVDDDAPFAAKRASCTFTKGATAKTTFGPSIAGAAIPIDTVVIVSQENRSFDEYFSTLPGVDPVPSGVMLLDKAGAPHARFHQTDYCFADTSHGWDAMHADWNAGANDGFVKVNDPNGARTLGWFDATDISFYRALAATYGTADHYFSALLGPTGPNRQYLYAATSSGHVENGHGLAAGQSNIFAELGKASVSFGVFSAGAASASCPGPYSFETAMFCSSIPGGAKTIADFVAAAKAGTLPHVSWIYPGSDEHPSADMQVGESKVQAVFDALAASPQWAHAAFVLVYDEGGGAYDHVPPPPACKPDALPPIVPGEASTPGAFDRYGFRVPFVVASPWSKPGYVSHEVASHTSLLRFLELRFGLPALSDRDANAGALLDMFDFTTPHFATPSVPPPVVVADPKTRGCP